MIGHGPHHPDKQIDGYSPHDPMGSCRPLPKSLAQNERGEEQQIEQAQTVGYEEESVVRK